MTRDINLVKLPDVIGGNPTGQGNGVALTTNGEYMAIAHNTTPYVTIYKRIGNEYHKLDGPFGGLPSGTANAVDFSLDGAYLAVGHASAPYTTVYKREGDTFNKLANLPYNIQSYPTQDLAWAPDGLHLATVHTLGGYASIYKRSGDTFTKLSLSLNLPTGGNGVAYSSDGQYMAITCSNTSYLIPYKRSGDSYTKLSDVYPNISFIYGVAFSGPDDDKYMAVYGNGTPYIAMFKRTGDTFNKLDLVGTLPTTYGRSVALSRDGRYLISTHDNVNNPFVFERDYDDSYGRLSQQPSESMTSTGMSVVFSGNDELVVMTNKNSPYITVYNTSLLVLEKYLVRDGNELMTWNTGTGQWQYVGPSDLLTQGDFDTYGMELEDLSSAYPDELVGASPELLMWSNSLTDISPQLRKTAVPHPGLIKATGDIDLLNVRNIRAFNVTTILAGSGKVRLMASRDEGITWYTHDGSNWASINVDDLAEVETNGMTPGDFNTIPGSAWDELVGEAHKIRFAYYLELDALTDQAETDALVATFDMWGIWEKAIHGTQYDYQYTDNTLLEVSLYANGDYKINY